MKIGKKIILLACVAISAAAVALLGWSAFGDHSETGFSRPSVEWLPHAASNVSFYRNSNIAGVHAYEFHISREDFEVLARERGWPVKQLEQEVFVARYVRFLPSNHPQRNEPFEARSSGGLFYEERRRNGGGISVLYDDITSMAYVFKSSR